MFGFFYEAEANFEVLDILFLLIYLFYVVSRMIVLKRF